MPDVNGPLNSRWDVCKVEGPGALKQPNILEERCSCALPHALWNNLGHVLWLHLPDAFPACSMPSSSWLSLLPALASDQGHSRLPYLPHFCQICGRYGRQLCTAAASLAISSSCTLSANPDALPARSMHSSPWLPLLLHWLWIRALRLPQIWQKQAAVHCCRLSGNILVMSSRCGS